MLNERTRDLASEAAARRTFLSRVALPQQIGVATLRDAFDLRVGE
jgi:hypothetical protein